MTLALPVSRAMAWTAVAGARVGPFTVRETTPVTSPKPRLLDRVREAIRARHYSRRTEKTYVAWIRRYILFHSKRHYTHVLNRGPGGVGSPVDRLLDL